MSLSRTRRRRSFAWRILRCTWRILRAILAACAGLGPVPPPLPPRTAVVLIDDASDEQR